MRCRMLDRENDYSFGNNEYDYIDGIEAIAQTIRTKILLFYGEWWENIGIGIPMFQSILGQMNPEAIQTSLALLLTQRIQEVDGVSSVEDVTVQITNRAIAAQVKVNTRLGETVVEVAL